jgi:hypothetical protein
LGVPRRQARTEEGARALPATLAICPGTIPRARHAASDDAACERAHGDEDIDGAHCLDQLLRLECAELHRHAPQVVGAHETAVARRDELVHVLNESAADPRGEEHAEHVCSCARRILSLEQARQPISGCHPLQAGECAVVLAVDVEHAHAHGLE